MSSKTVRELLHKNSEKVTFSLEFIPPSKDTTRSQFLSKIEPLMSYGPLFVNVTTHRNSTELIRTKEGLSVYEHTKHISTLPICDSIAQRFGTLVVPHVMCGGFTKDETEDLLLDAHYLEINNLFAVRGDALSVQKTYIPGPNENVHSLDLIKQIKALNEGIYRDSYVKNPVKTSFCVGSTFYPEKHIESPNFECEYRVLADKIASGADYFISQMFFDNAAFFKYIKGLEEYYAYGTLPKWSEVLIPGIKPLTTEKQLRMIPSCFAVRIPNKFVEAVQHGNVDASISYTVEQCRELIVNGYNHLHFFTSNSLSVIKVIEQL